MKPYWQADGLEIYHGDVLEVLADLEGLTVDLTLTDPPYNIGLAYGHGSDRREDYAAWCAAWFGVVRPMSTAVALTCGHMHLGLWYGICAPDALIAWHKPGCKGASAFGFCNWEPVAFWGTPTPRGTDVVTAPILQGLDVDHPCPKPLAWATGLLRLLSDPDKLVLDPFLGSGTTLIAAKQLGRRGIGVEREERWCELAARRLDATLPLLETCQWSLLEERQP